MKHRPVHSFTVPVWSSPRSHISVHLWRTLTQMKAFFGPVKGDRKYEALTLQYGVEKGELAGIHLALTRCGADVVAHEVFHACVHVARVADACFTEEEEEIASLLDGLVAVIQEQISVARNTLRNG